MKRLTTMIVLVMGGLLLAGQTDHLKPDIPRLIQIEADISGPLWRLWSNGQVEYLYLTDTPWPCAVGKRPS